MNPMTKQLLGMAARYLVMLAAARGYQVAESDVSEVLFAAAGAAVVLWSALEKVHARQLLVTALGWADVTENDVTKHVAKGDQLPPVTTKPDTVPEPRASI